MSILPIDGRNVNPISPTACTCRDDKDHCAHCRAVEARIALEPCVCPSSADADYRRTRCAPCMARANIMVDAEGGLLPQHWVGERELCRLMGISRQTMRTRVIGGLIPRPIRFGRDLIFWRRVELMAWMKGEKRYNHSF